MEERYYKAIKMSTDPYYTIGLQKYMQLQMLEIDEHKYYLSQYFNHDVGYNVATMDFIMKGHAKRFRDNFVEHHAELEELNDCGKLEEILKTHDCNTVHKILKDI